jgi:hypothetical protein
MWAVVVEVLAAAVRMVRGAAAAVQDGRGRRGDGGATEGRRSCTIGLTDWRLRRAETWQDADHTRRQETRTPGSGGGREGREGGGEEVKRVAAVASHSVVVSMRATRRAYGAG